MNKTKFNTKFLVEMALLVAIILIMAFTPIGYIKTAGLCFVIGTAISGALKKALRYN